MTPLLKLVDLHMQDIEIIEEINEGNLYLRKISKEDSQFFYESLKEEKMTQFLSLGPLISFNHSKKLIKNHIDYWERWYQFNYIIEIREGDNISMVGSVSLWNISWLHRRADVGIWILPNFWNDGIGSKSLNLIKNIAFLHLNLNRIQAYIAIKNERSINLFQNCGFVEEGILIEYLSLNGKFHDAKILACLKSNFFY